MAGAREVWLPKAPGLSRFSKHVNRTVGNGVCRLRVKLSWILMRIGEHHVVDTRSDQMAAKVDRSSADGTHCSVKSFEEECSLARVAHKRHDTAKLIAVRDVGDRLIMICIHVHVSSHVTYAPRAARSPATQTSGLRSAAHKAPARLQITRQTAGQLQSPARSPAARATSANGGAPSRARTCASERELRGAAARARRTRHSSTQSARRIAAARVKYATRPSHAKWRAAVCHPHSKRAPLRAADKHSAYRRPCCSPQSFRNERRLRLLLRRRRRRRRRRAARARGRRAARVRQKQLVHGGARSSRARCQQQCGGGDAAHGGRCRGDQEVGQGPVVHRSGRQTRARSLRSERAARRQDHHRRHAHQGVDPDHPVPGGQRRQGAAVVASGAPQGRAGGQVLAAAGVGAPVRAARQGGEDGARLHWRGGGGDCGGHGQRRRDAARKRALLQGGDQERAGVCGKTGGQRGPVRERRVRHGAPRARLDGRGDGAPQAVRGGPAAGEGAGVPVRHGGEPGAAVRGDRGRVEGVVQDRGARAERGVVAGGGGQAGAGAQPGEDCGGEGRADDPADGRGGGGQVCGGRQHAGGGRGRDPGRVDGAGPGRGVDGADAGGAARVQDGDLERADGRVRDGRVREGHVRGGAHAGGADGGGVHDDHRRRRLGGGGGEGGAGGAHVAHLDGRRRVAGAAGGQDAAGRGGAGRQLTGR
ncbi:hypothetical protein FGB62_8g329 [Gracilaria domingensis]|nr:hypothetical protein FGB62_8g329 [Gracilaria domingensis]